MRIALLPGDGVGPEILEEVKRVLRWVQTHDGAPELSWEQFPVGGASLDEFNTPLRQEVLAEVQHSDAAFLGAVGGPEWEDYPIKKRPEKALLTLREECDLFANLRPIRVFPSLVSSSPLKGELAARTDLLIVRELTGGIYFSEPRGIDTEGDRQTGYNTLSYSSDEIERITEVAIEAAQRRGGVLTSVDKANVLESSRLWRETVQELVPESVELNHLYVDNAAMQIIRDPGQFDVIVTGNLFGDILSDAAAQLPGSIGLLPSASIRDDSFGLYEPVHGSAPDIAGESRANPIAALLSLALMFRYSLNSSRWGKIMEEAVENTLKEGYRTEDIADQKDSTVSTKQMGEAVLESMKKLVRTT